MNRLVMSNEEIAEGIKVGTAVLGKPPDCPAKLWSIMQEECLQHAMEARAKNMTDVAASLLRLGLGFNHMTDRSNLTK